MGTVAIRAAALTIVAWAVVGSAALATVFNDREYQLGDDGDNPAASPGNTVGVTYDSAGSLGVGDLQDIIAVGGPTYATVSGRPQANGSTLGVSFDGVDDALSGFPVNRPDEMKSIIDAGSGSPPFPNNYTGILGHGLQLWVFPDAGALGSSGTPSTFQSIVADTDLSGGPAINAIGQWTQTNSNHSDGGDGIAPVPASVDVPAGDTWYHVMHHHQPIAGSTFASILYVDGVAVSANIDNIPTASTVFNLVVGARQVSGDPVSPVYGNYFNGVIDDLEMYVFGDNTSEGGTDWGTFDLFSDNEWIKNAIDDDLDLQGTLDPGDVNKDGNVNGDGTGAVDVDDVSAFVAGWLSQKSLPGAHGTVFVGDWNTWDDGDMNHDGRTTLADAFILHEALLANGSAGLDFSLLGENPVPEPSTVALILVGLVGLAAKRRRSI